MAKKITFAGGVSVCEYVIGRPIEGFMTENDEWSCLYEEKLSPMNKDENPCYRMSQMIKEWFNISKSQRCCGYWFATDVAQEHLGYIVFRDRNALKGEYDEDFFANALEIMGIALREKIKKLEESNMKKVLFWDCDVGVGGMGGIASINRFYDQYLEYKVDMNEIQVRRERDELRSRELEAIEREISLLSNISRKCAVTESKLYKHPTCAW
jgi:hypothetical protein